MSFNLTDGLFIYVRTIDFGGQRIWFGVTLHLAYTRMDEMLNIKNSPAIMARAPPKLAGEIGGEMAGDVIY